VLIEGRTVTTEEGEVQGHNKWNQKYCNYHWS